MKETTKTTLEIHELHGNKLREIMLEKSKNKKVVKFIGGDLEQLFNELNIISKFGNKTIKFINQPTFIINTTNGEILTNEEYQNPPHSTVLNIQNLRIIGLDDIILIKNKTLYLYSLELLENNNKFIFELRFGSINLEKKKVTFTISETIYDKFDELADKLAINKSKFVENRMKEFIDKHN